MLQEKEYLEPPKYVFEFIHFIFAVVFLILSSLHFNMALLFYESYKITIFTFVFFAVGSAYFLIRKIPFSKTTVFIMISCLVLSLAGLTSSMDASIELLWFLVLHLSALLFALSSYFKDFSDDFLYSAVKSVVSPFQSFFTLPLALVAPLTGIKKGTAKNSRNIIFVIIGIAVSIPIIFVVCSLLLSDMFFHNFASVGFDAFTSLILRFNVTEYINFFTLFVAFYLFGAFYNAERTDREPPRAFGPIPSPVSSTVISMLLFFYVLFFISQLVGIIQCFLGNLPSGETYSSFARSGFFSLCIVACINGIIIYFANKNSENKLTKILSASLCIATLFIIGTAFSKMALYIYNFGYTPKRFYTIWFMLLLLITFVLSIIKLRKKSFKLSQAMIYITYSMLFILFFINFESLSLFLNA